MSEYLNFLLDKRNKGSDSGFDPVIIPDFLMDFQKYLVEWAVRKGRCAIFSDCGTGKTIMQLVWADNVTRHTNKPVLILTPLAVSLQTEKEAAKFGIDCARSKDGKVNKNIVITNYEKLHFFNWQDFSGVVCDESSILKSFDGARKSEITEFMRKIPYRLLATATAAPNDYTELGTSSEALGYLGHMDMLGRFFKNDQSNCTARRMYGEAPKWRFKGHSELPFWRWVTSWARAIRKPSDIGFSDDGFTLKPLIEIEHVIKSEHLPDGMFLDVPANTLQEQREEQKRTIEERCDAVAKLVNSSGKPFACWCNLNEEGKYLESIIPDALQISGSDSDDKKEEKFISFVNGQSRGLITKAKIGAWGLNFQHCAHATVFPSHSYEQYYQLTRRFWRFGQKEDVKIDIVLTEGARKVMNNLMAKSKKAAAMFQNLVNEMNNSISISKHTEYNAKEEVPSWL